MGSLFMLDRLVDKKLSTDTSSIKVIRPSGWHCEGGKGTVWMILNIALVSSLSVSHFDCFREIYFFKGLYVCSSGVMSDLGRL
jgi:hypothetical protein